MATFDNFDEIQFPTTISYSLKGGPSFSTNVQSHKSGHEGRVGEWQLARGYWEINHTIKTEAQYDVLLQFFMARAGRFYGFRYKDFFNFRANVDGVTPQALGTGDGSTTTFQLIKTYTDGIRSYVQTIYKPVNNGTLKVYKNGVIQATPADYSINYTTGIITFGIAPASPLPITAYYEFDFPARFGSDKLEGSYEQFNNLNWSGIPIVELRPR
jgi:uncharacterized protein (TIGR02217 family)